jgi:hypothetical protein
MRALRLRNLWRLVGSTNPRAVLPVATVLLVATVIVGRTFGTIGIAASVVAVAILAVVGVRAMSARVAVDGNDLVFETLAGRDRISVAKARLATLEDVSWGSRLLGLWLDGRPFYRQPLALYTEAEWAELLPSDSSDTMLRAESLWSLLRRRD